MRLIGEGNHGRFYLAHPPARLGIADEYVAVKVFAGQYSEDAYRRGTRELRAFAAVESPYLVRVYDAVLEDNFLYAMEYFPLGSLGCAGPTARRGTRCCAPWSTPPAPCTPCTRPASRTATSSRATSCCTRTAPSSPISGWRECSRPARP